MNENDTFNELKYGRYRLIITLNPSSDEEVDIILDGMRTTLDDEGIITEDGDQIFNGLDLNELTAEIFCLGTCYERISEENGIDHPFDYIVEKEW